jgi:DNA-binding transcriptional LysR family regulator
VASKGSLTAAAHAEGVAPAVIGRRIDALEERLGVKLLVRTTRRISLTHEGSAFLDDCQRLLVDLANAEASVSEGGVKASGYLRAPRQRLGRVRGTDGASSWPSIPTRG